MRQKGKCARRGRKGSARTVRATEPKYRKVLRANQVELLQLLYNVRYASTDIVAELVKKDRSTIYESLFVLEKQGYVHKLYDKTYRLRQRPAIYCLAAKGIKYLRDNGFDAATLKNFYKNRSMRDEFIDKHLLIAKAILAIRREQPGKFAYYTKYQLDKEDYVSPLPDLFIERIGKSQKPDYVLDVFEPGTFTWLLRRRISKYQEHSEESKYLYPNVLFVCQNQSTEKRLFKLTYENYYDYKYYLTQQDILLNNGNGKVWIDMDEIPDEDDIQRVKIV